MLVYQNIMFDRYYCIKSFFHLKKFGKKHLEKVGVFLYNFDGAQKHEKSMRFESFCSRAKTNAIQKSLNYVQCYSRY